MSAIHPVVNNLVMDPTQCLPPEMAVESFGDFLYRIGLSFHSIRDRPKRKLIYHPLTAFVFLSLYLIARIITFSLSEENEMIFRALGCFGHFIGVRQHFDLLFILSTILVLTSQLIYYQNFRNGIKPSFLRLFHMMAGLVPPKSVGLTDVEEIKKLIRLTSKFYQLIHFHTKYVLPIYGSTFQLTLYVLYTHPLEILYFGIPNALLFALWIHYYWNFFLYQLLVFYIICLYFKSKINRLNKILIVMKRRKRFIRIRETLQSFDLIYKEINEYNTTFWSKFLLSFWLTYGLNVSLFSYITIFAPMVILLRIILIYILIVFFISFLFIIFTASSVTYCANKSYKILNSFFISYSKHNKLNKHLYWTRTSRKLKVILQ